MLNLDKINTIDEISAEILALVQRAGDIGWSPYFILTRIRDKNFLTKDRIIIEPENNPELIKKLLAEKLRKLSNSEEQLRNVNKVLKPLLRKGYIVKSQAFDVFYERNEMKVMGVDRETLDYQSFMVELGHYETVLIIAKMIIKYDLT